MSDPDNPSSSESEAHNASIRPNRWTGPPTTWQSLTEAERSLAASLDTIRSGDLSIHLFNAHALKRRARELEDPEGRRKSVSDFPGIPDKDQAFKPPKGWTAWPLPAEEVPRGGEEIGPSKEFEEYTFKAEEDGAPSRELEDLLMGVTLKFAKERFENREEKDYTYKGKGKGKGKSKVAPDDDMDSTGSEYHDASNDDEPVIKEAAKSPQPNSYLKPVVSADDERSRELLRPSIRHTLCKLDEVLMALHHARRACHRYSHSEAGTTDDESVADTTISEQRQDSPSKRAVGRPRKFADLPTRSKADLDRDAQKAQQGDPLRPKASNRGRPKKIYERLEGETEQEYAVRVARLQKKPLPAVAPPTDTHTSKSPSPRRGRERSKSVASRRALSEEKRGSRRRKLELRDWSEVLGVAALVGFEPDVLDRATRRCANLFGEGMVMRRMAELPFGDGVSKDEVVWYRPELIPNLDEYAIELSSSDDESASDSASQPGIMPGVRTRSKPSRQAVFCPIQTCPRRVQGFRDMAAVRRHLEKGHRIQKDEVEDYILPSDEEMDRAVHIDGFLKPMKGSRAPRGRYRKQAKKRKARESEDDEEASEDEGRSQRNQHNSAHVMTTESESGGNT